MDQELKDFLGLVINDLKADIATLSGVVKDQSVLIREIEIKSITRVAELQKDIEGFRKDLTEVKAEQKAMGDSQKLKWKTLSEERAAERKEQATKDEKQAVINSGFETIGKLLWAILLIVASILIGFVWQLVVNGGIKGILP